MGSGSTRGSELVALLNSIGAPTEVFAPPTRERLSGRCDWFADDDRLVLVTRPEGKAVDAEYALAYGLAYSGDRDLWLVTHAAGARLLAPRLPWLSARVHVFETDGTSVVPFVAPSKHEVLAGLDDPLADAVVQLDDRAGWVEDLVIWADAAPGVRAAPRSQYLSWHCDGRQILCIRRQGLGLKLVAGVDAKDPAPGAEPCVVLADGPLAEADTLRLIAAAARAAADRLEGIDRGHGEHLLQSRLDHKQVGLVEWRREFPAIRPGVRRGYIDFLGVDTRGDVHVVETKIGPDERLVLQGLDYWVWASAHAPALRQAFGLARVPRIHLDFVVAERGDGGGLTSIYTPAQVEALDGEIPWHFHTVSGWHEGLLSVQRAPRGVVPGTPRRAGTSPLRWANRLDLHLRSWAPDEGVAMRTTHHVKDPLDNIIPASRAAYRQLADQGLLHHQVAHLRSSQAFALNLLAPLDGAAWATLLAGRVPVEIAHAEPAIFEFQDADDHLAEATDASPHRTQTDALVRLTGPQGSQHAVLIEVKLTEPEFGTCSAWASARNNRRYHCVTPGPFGGDTTGCFQLANHDHGQRRTYDTYLGPLDGPLGNTGCWFREANQIMRNVALARVLIATGQAASATVALMAPAGHHSIWRQWREHTPPLTGIPGITFAELPAEHILAAHDPTRAAALADRYLPSPDHDEASHQVHALQSRLDRLFPHGAHVITENLDDNREIAPGYTMPLARPLAALTHGGEPLLLNTDYPNGLTYPWPAGLDRTSNKVRVELAPLPHRRILTNDLSALTDEQRRELSARANDLRDRDLLPRTDIEQASVIR